MDKLAKYGKIRANLKEYEEALPPLDDFLRNPIYISPEAIEESALQDAKQVLRERRYPVLADHEVRSIKMVDGKEYVVKNVVQRNRDGSYGNRNEVMHAVEDVIDKRLNGIVGLKDKMRAARKRELGLVSNESDRGQMIQILKEAGIDVAESRKLDYHIGRFLEAQKQECVRGNIKPGRLRKIVSAIGTYTEWSPIINGSVARIGTKEHIEAYHSFLAKRISDGAIKKRYANDLFGEFKALINWLVTEEILKDYPRCLQLKSTRYRFAVVRQTPKVIPLPVVRKILEAATDNPRLKLFVLLTLNCGFGASEIGQLQKDEYDSATGRITHRRYKTEKSDTVPTVVYKLWAETKELLDMEIANRKNYPARPHSAKLLLANENGMPLWSESIDKGKSDNITSSFKRLIEKLRKIDSDFPPISYYRFRKTVSTLIFNSEDFTGLEWLWLGHAPSTMAGQSYNAAANTRLDRCIEWLHGEIFDVNA